MTSAEPLRRSAYSQDIALRVVWMRLGMSLSFRSIADRLQIGLGSAYRLYKRYVDTGTFAASKRCDRPHCRKLDEHHELLVLGLLMENPGLYLAEICFKIYEDCHRNQCLWSNCVQAPSKARLHKKKDQASGSTAV